MHYSGKFSKLAVEPDENESIFKFILFCCINENEFQVTSLYALFTIGCNAPFFFTSTYGTACTTSLKKMKVMMGRDLDIATAALI
jgi:hypothetical protein